MAAPKAKGDWARYLEQANYLRKKHQGEVVIAGVAGLIFLNAVPWLVELAWELSK